MYVIENNIMSIIIALIIFVSLRVQTYRSEHLNKLFFFVLWADVFMLVINTFMIFLNGMQGEFVHVILSVLLVIYFIATPVVAFLCVAYLDFEIYKNEYKFKKRHSMFLILIILSIIFSILSLKGYYLFELSDNNEYIKGYLFSAYAITIFIAVVTGFFLSLGKAEHLKKKDLTPLGLFSLAPTVSMVFTIYLDQLGIIWNALAISLLIMYIFLQLKITNTDFLTGLFNRREFEYQLNKIKNLSNKNEKIYGMIIDLDDFKSINDLYGHVEGDTALVNIGDILKASVRKHDFVSRIGGDEFAIILSARDTSVVELIVDRIKQNILEFNQNNNFKYNLKISYGYDSFEEDKYETVIDFFNHIDMKMYIQKHSQTK